MRQKSRTTAYLTSVTPLAALALSALIGVSCSGEDSAPPVAEDLTSKYYDVLLGDRPVLGLVTGGIYVAGDQPLSTHGDAFFSELGRLGARWIRFEANWTDTPPEVYRSIVQKAHASNISVVVVVPHGIVNTVPDPRPNSAGLPPLYCAKDDNPKDIDFFTSAYVSSPTPGRSRTRRTTRAAAPMNAAWAGTRSRGSSGTSGSGRPKRTATSSL
jgi:hypothetical protein